MSLMQLTPREQIVKFEKEMSKVRSRHEGAEEHYGYGVST